MRARKGRKKTSKRPLGFPYTKLFSNNVFQIKVSLHTKVCLRLVREK